MAHKKEHAVGKKHGKGRGKLKIIGGETMGEKKVSKKMCK